MKGRGGAGANGGPPGDLFVVVRVQSHPLFGRSGNDLTIRLPVTFAEATLGADVKVPTLDGQVTMRIPPGTPSGKVMRVRGQGVAGETTDRTTHRRPKRKGGDLLVTVDVVGADRSSTSAQREAVEALAAAFADDPRARAVREAAATEGALMADTRALYVISVAAELAGVHPQTLRIYERKGLLAPARTSGRSRRYSDHDIQLLRRIQELTNEGISLVGRAAHPRARSTSSTAAREPRRRARSAPRRACSARWRSASRPRTSSTGARSSRSAAPRSCSPATNAQ